jgi:hypothetical protein
MATTGVVVHVKAIGATTNLGAVSAANHGTITSGRWSTAIRESIGAIFEKQGEWASAEI